MFSRYKVLGTFVFLFCAGAVGASDGKVQQHMDKLADEIPPVLERLQSKSVQIGRINGPYHTTTGYGTLLREALKASLTKVSIPVQLRSDVILSGTPAGSRPVEPGDTVSVDVEGLGTLTNNIVEGDESVAADYGAQPTESEEVRSTALGGDWEYRGIRKPQ